MLWDHDYLDFRQRDEVEIALYLDQDTQEPQYNLFIALSATPNYPKNADTPTTGLYSDPSFLLSIVGTLASLIGLVVSFLSWRAALKAKDAAVAAAEQIRGIDAVVETTRLQTLCKTSLEFLEQGAFEQARNGVKDIRQGVIILKSNKTTKQYLNDKQWGDITLKLAEIRDYLTDVIDSQDNEGAEDCKKGCTPKLDDVAEMLIKVSIAAKYKAEKA